MGRKNCFRVLHDCGKKDSEKKDSEKEGSEKEGNGKERQKKVLREGREAFLVS